MAKFPTNADADNDYSVYSCSRRAIWIRIRKTTSRPRRKEPPAGPWGLRKAVHTRGVGLLVRHRTQQRGQLAGNSIISVSGSQEVGVESWDRLG